MGPSGARAWFHGRQARAARQFSGPPKSVPFVHLYWPINGQIERLKHCFYSRLLPQGKGARWTRPAHKPLDKYTTNRAASGPSAKTGRGRSNPWSFIGSTPCPQSFLHAREIKSFDFRSCLLFGLRYASRTRIPGGRVGFRDTFRDTQKFTVGLWLGLAGGVADCSTPARAPPFLATTPSP